MWSLIAAIVAINNWQYIVGAVAAVLGIILIRGIARRNAARKRQARIAAAEAAERARAEQARIDRQREEKELKEREARKSAILAYTSAYNPPAEMNGQLLYRSYPDVEYFVPEYYYARASAVPPHQTLALSPDPSNEHDSGAIGIYYDSRLVGYMYKNRLRDMAVDFMTDSSRSLMAVSMVWKDNKPTMGLFFYRDASYVLNAMARRDDAREFTLTGNRSADMQDTISFCAVGEEIAIEYDQERERYSAEVGSGSIGLFPVSAVAYLEKYGSFEARISELEEDEDTGKYTVTVILAPARE